MLERSWAHERASTCSGYVMIDRPKRKMLFFRCFLQFSERFRLAARYRATGGFSSNITAYASQGRRPTNRFEFAAPRRFVRPIRDVVTPM